MSNRIYPVNTTETIRTRVRIHRRTITTFEIIEENEISLFCKDVFKFLNNKRKCLNRSTVNSYKFIKEKTKNSIDFFKWLIS